MSCILMQWSVQSLLESDKQCLCNNFLTIEAKCLTGNKNVSKKGFLWVHNLRGYRP